MCTGHWPAKAGYAQLCTDVPGPVTDVQFPPPQHLSSTSCPHFSLLPTDGYPHSLEKQHFTPSHCPACSLGYLGSPPLNPAFKSYIWSWGMVAYTFNLSAHKAEAGKSLRV